MATLTKTKTPGIFRRHVKGCDGQGRCECSYVVVWRHRGKQHKETFRTYAEASEAQGNRKAGDRRPTSTITFEDYFAEWIETYAGRTARGFSETTRPEYRRPIEAHAIPKWGTWQLAEVDRRRSRAVRRDAPRRQEHVGDQEAARRPLGDVRDGRRGRHAALEPLQGRPHPRWRAPRGPETTGPRH